jgi:hypothetical protein
VKRALPVMTFVACLAALIFGLIQLFKLRFESGDVYPAYSSLRSDPLGTMVFFESLDSIDGVETQRDFSARNRLPEGRDTTYLHIAGRHYYWDRIPEDLFSEIELFLSRGGRLVIAMQPVMANTFSSSMMERVMDDEPPTRTERRKAREKKNSDGEKEKEKKTDDKEDEKTIYASKSVSLKERWGLDFALIDLGRDEEGTYEPASVFNTEDMGLSKRLHWHSGIVLTNLANSWKTVYVRGGRHPVVAERSFFNGSVVIATDSYFLSNEAMLEDRQAALLSWLVGPNKKVIFDEAHFGIMETPGVTALMRRYRLQWLGLGLFLLTGLFIWKNASSLAPPHVEPHSENSITGKESTAGFLNLLRRNISSKQLLSMCFAEWKKTAAAKHSAQRRQEAEQAFQAEQSSSSPNAMGAYKRIHQILEIRKTEHKS